MLDTLLEEFQDVFPKELPKALSPKCNIDHNINLILSTSPISIPPYQLSQFDEDEIASQLSDYLRMGHICHSKSP